MEIGTEPSIEDVKREAAQHVESNKKVERTQLIIFKLGSEEYALEIDQIKEVVLTPRIAKMPQTADFIMGVANIRGNVIAILDLEKCFGLSSSEATAAETANFTLVVESETFRVGILVKEVPNTLSVAVNEIDNSSNFVQSNTVDESTIKGVVKSGDRLIILIDMIKLMESDDIKSTVQSAIH